MLIIKTVSFWKILSWTWHYIIALLFFIGIVAAAYHWNLLRFHLPWLPVSIIGTAVAFYVGFKNNSAYDRMWEARKIWGAIVNDSRTWGMLIMSFITDQFTNQSISEEDLVKTKRRLVYRHIAWLYSLRSQLLVPTPWEHVSQEGHIGKTARYYQRRFGIGLLNDGITLPELDQYLPKEEHDRLIGYVNTATQIINEQGLDLMKLRKQGIIEDFRHMEMTGVLSRFYEHQGKCERIKKFPLPRQYASISRVFVGIFILLLPFSMIPEMMQLGSWGFWLSIPITALIGWVYVMMEEVGDYSENPFQGMANDIPMLSLCRTIEIDLKQMLNEEPPEAIQAKNDILM